MKYNSYEKYELCEMAKIMNCEENFYGSATVGERGQLVIPAEAREELGIHPGDKVTDGTRVAPLVVGVR